MQIGDASGIQSPLSFGGFGALTRHLQRLTDAVSEALEADCLDKVCGGVLRGDGWGAGGGECRHMQVGEVERADTCLDKVFGGGTL